MAIVYVCVGSQLACYGIVFLAGVGIKWEAAVWVELGVCRRYVQSVEFGVCRLVGGTWRSQERWIAAVGWG